MLLHTLGEKKRPRGVCYSVEDLCPVQQLRALRIQWPHPCLIARFKIILKANAIEKDQQTLTAFSHSLA